MKKKICLLILLLTIAFPAYAHAASVSVSLSCPATAKASSIVSCTVAATPSGSDMKGIQANINITNATYNSFALASGWTSYSSSASGFSLGRSTAATSRVNVGTLKVKMPSSGSATVKLTNVAASDSNYATLGGNSPSATIRVQSNVNTLSALSISMGTLSPAFNANTTSYSATVDATSITINATATDSHSKISGHGKKNLNYGKNTFNVVVTSESGVKKTYTIVINRPDKRDTNNNLKSLSVSKGSISFNKNTTSYKVNVDSNVSSIKVSAAVENTKASFVNGYGPRTVNLKYGNNTILIKVKAENEKVKTYTITVNRKDNRNSDSTLSSLSVEPAKINFNKNTTTYSASVPYEVSSVKVEYSVNDSKAKAQVIGSEKLNVGTNKIIVKVTAENEKVTQYVINITRQKQGEKVLDKDSSLKELTINGKKVELNSEFNYILEIDKEGKAEVEAVANKDTSNAKVSKPEKLVDGSIVSITVEAENGDTSTYLVSCIVKETANCDNNDTGSSNTLLFVIITAVILELLNIIIYKTVLSKKRS